MEVLEKLVAEHPAPEEYRDSVQNGERDLGALLKDSGRLEEARDCWKKEAGVLETLIKDFPDNQGYPRDSRRRAQGVGRVGQGDRREGSRVPPKSSPRPETPKTEPQERGNRGIAQVHVRTGASERRGATKVT